MQRTIIFFLILFLSSITWAQKVQVLSGVNYPPPPKADKLQLLPPPQNLAIDDEMLPVSSALYLFEVCTIGKKEIPGPTPSPQLPPQRGASKASGQAQSVFATYREKRYQTVTNCKDYVAADTPVDKRNMLYTALRELYVPNRQSHSINLKAFLGHRNDTFTLTGKDPVPYTVPYDEMPADTVLKKIITDPGKIKQFHTFSLPAAVFLGVKIQKRPNNHLPIRITFYERKLETGLVKTFIVFVFNEGDKYTYSPAELAKPSDTVTVYDIVPDFVVQYLKNT